MKRKYEMAFLYVYDIQKLKEMQEVMSDYQFSSFAFFLNKYNNAQSLRNESIDEDLNQVIDITNWFRDSMTDSIPIENYIIALHETYPNIRFAIQGSHFYSFEKIFPYFFDEDEISFEFQLSPVKSTIFEKTIDTKILSSLYTYKSPVTIKKLYDEGHAISLSNLMEDFKSLSFNYNLDSIKAVIEREKIQYIDLTSTIEMLHLRKDLIFQFEALMCHLTTKISVKYSLNHSLEAIATKLFPLVFDNINELSNVNSDSDVFVQEIDITEIGRLADEINKKLKGHLVFKTDFKRNLLKFTHLNKISERKILSIFLCGESGIGKTEFAKIVSNTIYNGEPLIKINFGNYSENGVLNSLIGSPLGYVGSDEGGELINKLTSSKSKVILIDEFEKATLIVHNFFYELLEDGKFTDRHGVAHDLNSYIIIFTSNMNQEQFQKNVSNALKSRLDMVYNFEKLTSEDKKEYIFEVANTLIEKFNVEFDIQIEMNLITESLNELATYNNLRDIKRRIEDIVFDSFIIESME